MKYFLFLMAPLAFAVAGCNHFTTQEATEACNDLLNSSDTEPSVEVFDTCVACHENCGDECERVAPSEFACPDELEGAGGGD